MKKFLALLIGLVFLCSCQKEEIPPEIFGELEQNPGETCTLPEDIVQKEEEPEEKPSRTEKPEIEDFNIIYFLENEGEIYTVKIEEHFFEEFAVCLKWKSWVGPAVETSLVADKWNPTKTVLLDDSGNRLEVYSNGTETIIKLLWGENWENSEYFMAPQKVARSTRAFCNERLYTSDMFNELLEDGKFAFTKPDIEDFDVIWTGGNDGGTMYNRVVMTDEEYEKIQSALQKDTWVEFDPEVHIVDYDELGPSENDVRFYISTDIQTETMSNMNYLYVTPYDEYTKITLRWGSKGNIIEYIAPKEVAEDIGAIRNEIDKASKSDGRNPFIPYLADEVNYLSAPEFDESAFEAHLINFVGHITGEYDGNNLPAPKDCILWCAVEAYKIALENGDEILYDEDGRAMIKAEDIAYTARYIFGIEDIETCFDFENGYYTLPFDGRIINPKVTLIEYNNGYIHCEVEFYDPDDSSCEGEAYAKKHYNFKAFEIDGRIWYRPISASFAFGGEWYF
ncbi:MAG: hypothetical protein IKU42_03560 [Oscillospiraceae bacterium]|nr:hypothetical protein [Oscillospiraceae bacterium]